MSAVQHIRAATATDHDAVDAAFGMVDFTDAASYGSFLMAHARALPAVEEALAGCTTLPPLRPRWPLLAADLRALALDAPALLPFGAPASAAAAFGVAYVFEGSRLGGGMLARRVGKTLPTGYLGATHRPGEWRLLLAALDQSATGEDWIAEASAAARATFDLYRRAASEL